MANFSLLRGAGPDLRPREANVRDTAPLAASLLAQSFGSQRSSGARGGAVARRASEDKETVEEKQLKLDAARAVIDKTESETALIDAQAQLANAARKGDTAGYGKALERVSPMQSQAFLQYTKNLAKGFMRQPGVAQAVGDRGPGSVPTTGGTNGGQ